MLFTSGTDEHGQKVEKAATIRGIHPKQFVDRVSQHFRDLLSTLHISNDNFSRTSDNFHKAIVQNLWMTLVEKGVIYKGFYEGWYSIREECFYTESELINGKTPSGGDVIWYANQPSYFFKLSQFEDKLLQHFKRHPDFVAPVSRRNEVLKFMQDGLHDLSISRTNLRWGIEVPGDKNHVIYVWLDALVSYISVLGYPDGKYFRKYWPAGLHIVGKDILRFHAVYWPAILMALGIDVPKRIFAHGWWTKDGEKISKSVGNVVDPFDLVKKYGVDQTRFFLITENAFGRDGDFSDRKMVLKVNANLSNELGNLCHRTLSMVFKYCEKAIPSKIGLFSLEDEALLVKVKYLYKLACKAVSIQALQKYADLMIPIIWDTNKYLNDMSPWSLKNTDAERMATVLYVALEVLRYIAILYQPLIPESANKILDQLKISKKERTFRHLTDKYRIKLRTPISEPKCVFPRLYPVL